MSIEAIQTTQFSLVHALPPGAQEELEKRAILKDLQVLKYLESIGAVATDVSRWTILDNGNYQYFLQTNTDFFIRVNFIYTHDEKILGPKKFELDVHPPEVPQKHATGLLFPVNLKA